MLFPLILILCEEKKVFFLNNLGIHIVIIYFCFVLIGLIKGYKNHKNIYSHNTLLW